MAAEITAFENFVVAPPFLLRAVGVPLPGLNLAVVIFLVDLSNGAESLVAGASCFDAVFKWGHLAVPGWASSSGAYCFWLAPPVSVRCLWVHGVGQSLVRFSSPCIMNSCIDLPVLVTH